MNNKKTRRILSCIVFVIYLCVLVYFLFFSENMGRVSTTSDYRYNLIPFKEIIRFCTNIQILGLEAVLLNTVGNVAAFIPFGLFVFPVSGRKITFLQAICLTIFVSLLVELIQLLTKVGTFDIDDLILNTIGGFIGAVSYLVWKKIERKREHGKAEI